VHFHKKSIPPPQKGQVFCEDPSIPIEIPVKLLLTISLTSFGLQEPLTPQEIPLPSVGGGGVGIFSGISLYLSILYLVNTQT